MVSFSYWSSFFLMTYYSIGLILLNICWCLLSVLLLLIISFLKERIKMIYIAFVTDPSCRKIPLDKNNKKKFKNTTQLPFSTQSLFKRMDWKYCAMIHSFNYCLLSNYCMPGILLRAKDTKGNQTEYLPICRELTFT